MRGNNPSVFRPALKIVYFSWMNQNFLHFHFGLLLLCIGASDPDVGVRVGLVPRIFQSIAKLRNINFCDRKERWLPNPFLVPENTDFVCSSSEVYFLAQTALITLRQSGPPTTAADQMKGPEGIKVIVKIWLAAISEMLTALLNF